MSTQAPEFDHLPQDSETVALLRNTDWSSTPLGHPSTWPEALRLQLNICFESAFPIAVWWGPDLIQFYNDGYRPILGATKHPQAFGGPAIATWPDIWPTIGPLVEQVVEQGIAVKGEDMPLVLERNGYPELCHFTFSYSPIRNVAGRIDGMFTAAVETSERVQLERRLAFLLDLADVLRLVNDPLEIAERATAMLGEHLGAGRAGYADVDVRAGTVAVDRDWTDGSMAGLAGEQRPLDSFGPGIIAELKAGRTLCLNDIGADPRSAPYAPGYASIGTRSLIVVPLQKHGRLTAILYLHCGVPRFWTPSDVALAEDVARCIADAIERAHAERQLQSERVRLQAVVDTIPAGLVMMDENGTLLIENDEWRRTWGGNAHVDGAIDYARYQGTWADSGAPVAPDAWPCFVSLKEGAFIKDVVIDIDRFDGSRGTIVVSSAPIRDEGGRVVGAVAANMDITDLRAAQMALLEAGRRKDEFLAMLGHELRNPLAPIATASDMLRMVAHGDARIARASEVIGRQVRHLSALVDDLLDVSRVTRGLVQLDKTVVDLHAIADGAVEQSRPLIEARRHALTVRQESRRPLVVGDRNRLVQIVVNLLNNAAKYTPEGGAVTLTIRDDGKDAFVVVEDNGIGIDAPLLPHVFDLFTQAERTPDRYQGGLGIGLALVKRIVNLHGGEIAAASGGAGAGAVFTVKLPLARGERTGG